MAVLSELVPFLLATGSRVGFSWIQGLFFLSLLVVGRLESSA